RAEAEPADTEVASDRERVLDASRIDAVGRPSRRGLAPHASKLRLMAEEIDRQALLTTLTTEHFTLQGVRASTISESSARSALYLGSLSALLVALGFVAQVSATGDTFKGPCTRRSSDALPARNLHLLFASSRT